MARTASNTFAQGINVFNKGMRCDIDPDDAGFGYMMLIKNLSLEKLGSLRTVREVSAFVDSPTGSPVQGLGSRIKSDSSIEIQRVDGGNVEYWDGDSWETRDASAYLSTVDVEMVDFKGRMYMAGGGTNIRWNDETTTGTLSPSIPANHLSILGNILIADFTPVDNLIIWSKPGTDQFYETSVTAAADADTAGANTLTISTGEFRVKYTGGYVYNPTTGEAFKITEYKSATEILTDGDTSGWDSDEIYIIINWYLSNSKITGFKTIENSIALFDRYNLYLIDIINGYENVYTGRGCISNKSIQVNNNGMLFWLSPNGVYALQSGGFPKKLSTFIENYADNDGIFELIDKDNLTTFAGGILNDNYLLTVGELTGEYQEEDLGEVTLVYNSLQDNWSLIDIDASIYHTSFDENGSIITLCGSSTTSQVYQLDAIEGDNVEWELRFYNTSLGRPDKDKTVDIYIRYKSDNEINVEYSMNNKDYRNLSTLPARSGFDTVHIPVREVVETVGLRFSGIGVTDISSIIVKGTIEEPKGTRK